MAVNRYDDDDINVEEIEDEKEADKKGKSEFAGGIFKDFLEISIYILCVLLAAYLFVAFIAQRSVVEGSSMYPTLHDKDNLVCEKVTYRFSDPERFDIIVFPNEASHSYFIKRIIALPGETIQIKDGEIYIDGELLDEDYGYEEIRSEGRASEPLTLGEDEYFVMGDNRNDSTDSRSDVVGNVKREDIFGRIVFRAFPFDRIGGLNSINNKRD